MNLVVILILAVLWAVVLVPQLVKARVERRPSDSVGAFQRQLSVLQRNARVTASAPSGALGARVHSHPASYATSIGASPVRPNPAPSVRRRRGGAPLSRAEAYRRRRAVLVGLVAAAGLTLVVGLVPALRVVLVAHVLVDVALIAYVALLVRARAVAQERAAKVRYLPTGGPAPDAPVPLLLQQSAN